MKKSIKFRVLSLIIASVVLSGALTVAAIMGSPYEILKESVLDACTYGNSTIEMQGTVYVNGEIYQQYKSGYVNGDEGSMNYEYDNNGNLSNCYYNSKTLNIYQTYTGLDGTKWYSAYARSLSPYDNFNSYSGGSHILNPEDRDSAQMRFVELVVDALVGDLKNNITMSSNGGVRLIQGTLVESQIPEIVKAGIDVLIEQQSSYSDSDYGYYEGWDKLSIPIKSLVINYAHGEAEVDADGNLLSVNFNGTFTIINILGDTNVVEINGNVRFTDIGTSVVSCPIPGAEDLFTFEYIQNKFGNGYDEYHGSVFFKLNEDGTIDEGSITTTYPGELENNFIYDDQLTVYITDRIFENEYDHEG